MEQSNDYKTWSSTPVRKSTIPYPFEEVVAAYNTRFPTNPAFPYIVDTQVTNENITPLLESKSRIIQLDVGFPFWLKRLSGISLFTVQEDSVIDRSNRTMSLKTHNLVLQDKIKVHEECVYSADPSNPNWTTKEMVGYLDFSYCRKNNCMWLKGPIERFASGLFESRGKVAGQMELEILEQKIY